MFVTRMTYESVLRYRCYNVYTMQVRGYVK